MPKKKKSKSSAMEQDIRRAAHSIPTLIAQDLERTHAELPIADSSRSLPPREDNQKKRQMVWAGVCTLTAVIFTVWFLNTRLMIGSLAQKKSNEGLILENASKNLTESLHRALPETQTDVPDISARQKIRDALATTFVAMAATTSTSSSQQFTTPTTISTATTTATGRH